MALPHLRDLWSRDPYRLVSGTVVGVCAAFVGLFVASFAQAHRPAEPELGIRESGLVDILIGFQFIDELRFDPEGVMQFYLAAHWLELRGVRHEGRVGTAVYLWDLSGHSAATYFPAWFVLPPLILVGSGLVCAHLHSSETLNGSILAGLASMPGYLVTLLAMSVWLVLWRPPWSPGATDRRFAAVYAPDSLLMVVIMGAGYALVFTTLGAAIWYGSRQLVRSRFSRWQETF